ncbi:MAG: nitrous oxide reductase family maturation protein NosD [Rhodocyclaceae bacterium]|nr:nitrous oxide reductase family maturation protein NosD [Rhodocyclaceae bacterium]
MNGRWRQLAPGMLFIAASLLATAQPVRDEGGELGWRGEAEAVGAGQAAATAPPAPGMEPPRVEVDRPKPVYPLYARDARIHGLRPFQELVDAAPAGSVLKPPPGRYAGPVVLTKKLIIDGGGQVTIDAGGKGTVFSLAASEAVLRGLHLTGSGDSHDTDDACLDVRGHGNLIEQLVIDDCLFGIDLKQSNDNVIRGNRIRSKPFALGVRGDGLRLWYSHGNTIEHNEIVAVRDMVAWYSSRNVFRRNVGRNSRYSFHFMFAKDSLVEDNRFYDNTVGIYLMYTERVHLYRNLVSHATGAAGMAIGFKESSDSDIADNDFLYCAVGVGSDLSPFQPGTTIRFRNNRFAYNGIAVHFTSELGGNVFTDNTFEGNLNHVIQSGRGKAEENLWHGNYWDDYQGFDRDGDGRGDTPYALYAYADQLWIDLPLARFFKASPLLELIDFLERLAPFSTPELQARDPAPRYLRPQRRTG